MKQILFILVAVLIVLACGSVAIVRSNDTKAAEISAVKSLKAELNNERLASVHKDQVNTLAIKNAGDQVILLTQQKQTLCTQIKTAKMVQPICN